jgi:glycosyltransferase involved in cell wall biosynthesis
MVTSSYPRFEGDAIATFMAPIATGIAALGVDVQLVAPWHPQWARPLTERGVTFHLYRYAPAAGLNVFGYAGALRADVGLRVSAVAVAPLALAAGIVRTRQVVRRTHASVVHAHWVIPGGAMGAAAARGTPLVISLHGSDVFMAEKYWIVRSAAAAAFRRAAWVTACSEDLRARAIRLGADPVRSSVVPYGVDADQFRPDPVARASIRERLSVPRDAPLAFAYGRLVSKKGFEYLVDAAALLAREWPDLRVVIAGAGDLDPALRARALAGGVAGRVIFTGALPQQEIPEWLASADVAVAPSVHDHAGNVDGLPNTVLEILASGTPLVATPVGGIAAVAVDGISARLVAERDAGALAAAIGDLLRSPDERARIGAAGRASACREYAWTRVARAFDAIYEHVAPRAAAVTQSATLTRDR